MKHENPSSLSVMTFDLTQLVVIDAKLRRAMLCLRLLACVLIAIPVLNMVYVSSYDTYMIPEEMQALPFLFGLVLFAASWPLGNRLRFAHPWAAGIVAGVVAVVLLLVVAVLSALRYLPSLAAPYLLAVSLVVLAVLVGSGVVAAFKARRLKPIGGKVDAVECLRFQTRAPPLSWSPSKLVLSAAYYALPLLAFALVAVLTSAIGFGPLPSTLIATVAAVGVGLWSWDRAKLVRQLTAVEASRRDPRAPAVLLRSFADDMLKLKPPLLSGKIVRENSFEEIITDQLWVRGPVIAIGRPREAIPPAGAARSYFSDAEWQGQAERMVGESQVIAMIVGITEGLGWEVRRVLRLHMLRKLLLIFPPVSAGESVDRWMTFLSHIDDARLVAALEGITARTLMMVSCVDDTHLAVFSAGERRDPLAYHLALAASTQLLPKEVLRPEQSAAAEPSGTLETSKRHGRYEQRTSASTDV